MFPLIAKNIFAARGEKNILLDVSLDLPKGHTIAILGPNGSGKTTLLHCLQGALRCSSGEILLQGTKINSLPAKQRARKMAVVPQNARPPQNMTVMDMALLGRYPWLSWPGFYRRADYDIVMSCLEKVDLLSFAHNRLETLSGGEWQRALLARALVQIYGQDSAVLLLDELAASLDIFRRVELFNLLARETHKNTSIIMAIHDCNLAAIYASQILGLKNGQILFYGTVTEVFTGENLSELYGLPIGILPHPDLGLPQAYPHFDSAIADQPLPCRRNCS